MAVRGPFLKHAMRNLFISAMLFIASIKTVAAQEYSVIDTVRAIVYYDYHFNETAGKPQTKRLLQMQLEIGDKYSRFQSSSNAYKDSLLAVYQHLPVQEAVTKILPMVLGMESHSYASYRVLKNYPNSNKISVFSRLDGNNYHSEEDLKLRWQINTERDTTIINLRCLMATTSYGGRDYVAWFAPDVPISDGPYKFCGLPGVIVQIADTENEHKFVLQGVRNGLNLPMYKAQERTQKVTPKELVRAFYDENANRAKRLAATITESSDPNIMARISQRTKGINNYIERY